jgi:hypothetical protein
LIPAYKKHDQDIFFQTVRLTKQRISYMNQYREINMPIYLQVILMIAVFIAIVLVILYMGGLAVRRTCLKIIAEMEEARAFRETKAVEIQDERKNFFRVGMKNIRPRALNLLLADGLVIKTSKGKYYLDKDKLAQAKAQLGLEN